MKSILSWAKKVAITGLATFVLASSSPALAKGPVQRPVPAPTTTYSTEIETQYQNVEEKGDEFTERVEILEGQNYLLRAEYGEDHSALGARVPLSGDLVNGSFDIFSAENTLLDTNGHGLNGDITLRRRFILGGALEKGVTPKSENTVVNGYAGLDLARLLDDNISALKVTIGAVQVQKGDETRLSYHQNAIMDWSRFIAGFGFQLSTEDYSFGHLVLGQYPQTKGKGFGWRGWATAERSAGQIDNTYVKADLMLTLDSNLTAGSYLEPFSTREGMHEGAGDGTIRKIDPFYSPNGFRVVDNANDYIRPGIPLHHRARTAATELEYGYDQNNNDWYAGNLVVYPAPVLRQFGLDIGRFDLTERAWIGGGYNSETGPNGKGGLRFKVYGDTELELYGITDKEKQSALLEIYHPFN